MKLLAKILKDQQMDKAVEALKTASQHGHPWADAIQQVHHQQMHGRGYRETVVRRSSTSPFDAEGPPGHEAVQCLLRNGRGEPLCMNKSRRMPNV